MSRLKLYVLVFVTAATMLLPNIAAAQTLVTVGNNADTRISGDLDLLPSGGSNGEENGGFNANLIGLNTVNIENWSLLGFDVSTFTGAQVVSATLNVTPNFDFSNPNFGDMADILSVHELHSGNAGWIEGDRMISFGLASTPLGATTFQNRSDFGPTPDPRDIPWVDGSGAALSNFFGAFDTNNLNTNTVFGYNSSTVPEQVEFDLNPTTVQGWLDAGSVAGIVLAVQDGGNSRSRFNFQAGPGAVSLNIVTVPTVPEPTSLAVVALGLAGFAVRRHR